MSNPTPVRAGFGRASITTYDPELTLLGWATEHNKAQAVARPLHARALVIESASGRRFAYVCCDLGIISESLRRHVLARLRTAAHGLDEHELMLTATHTHSGPSGYSTYLLYGLAGPGFSQPVHDGIVDGIVEAILAALASLTPASLFVHRRALPISEAIAFNRAVEIYNRNRDTSPRDELHRDEAVDREMTVLRVDRLDGRPLGLISWFGLHGTCVHSDHTVLHPDHKGEAATRLEREQAAAGNPDYVAIFAQTTAADVTPNFRWSAPRGFVIGRYDDDLESAAFVGEVQARHAESIAAEAPTHGHPLFGEFDAAVRYVDFFAAPIDPEHAYGRKGLRTSEPVLGWTFAAGTDEGPGPLHGLHALVPAVDRVRRATARLLRPNHDDAELPDAKLPFWELGRGRAGRMLALLPADSPLLALLPDASVAYYRRALEHSHADHLPWIPRHLPAQIFRFGPLVIAALPLEPTVVSGRRLQRSITSALAGIDNGSSTPRIVINGYANAYAGYLTTPEEYDAQGYEGACTMYGRNSLPAWATAFDELIRAMHEPPPRSLRSPPPPVSMRECLPHTRSRKLVARTPPPSATGKVGQLDDDDDDFPTARVSPLRLARALVRGAVERWLP
jgi:neutral ceramidase